MSSMAIQLTKVSVRSRSRSTLLGWAHGSLAWIESGETRSIGKRLGRLTLPWIPKGALCFISVRFLIDPFLEKVPMIANNTNHIQPLLGSTQDWSYLMLRLLNKNLYAPIIQKRAVEANTTYHKSKILEPPRFFIF